MSTEPVYILTLNETLPKKLEQLLNNETKERLKDELGRIKNHFVNVESLAGASSESARAVFQQMWSKLLASAAQIQADKKDVILNLLQEFKLDESDEALTLLSPIKNFDDFTFFAPKDCERATLLRLLYGKSEDLVSQLTEGDPLPPTPEDSAGKNDPAADLQRRALELSASKRLNKIVGKIVRQSEKLSHSEELWLYDGLQAVRGRVLACRYDKAPKQWSVTIRVTRRWPKASSSPTYLNKHKDINKLICEVVFGKELAETHGLVVITGRTGSCKSKIARELITKYLEARVEAKKENARPPHLLTYEDPIEEPLDIEGVDYTPREKGKSVADLEEAVSSALRQTPALLFVGEVRDKADWQTLLEFAGTGHLVVTTAHAGSLTEAMGNILQSVRANKPSARSVVGERLLAIIHLKPKKVTGQDQTEVGVLIPAVWHRTPEGIKALMAEGLSSVVPNTPKRPDLLLEPLSRPSSIGRYWFALELLKKIDERASKIILEKEALEIRTDALEWDFEGV